MIDEQAPKTRSSFWREFPILVGVAVLVAVLVRAFVLQTFYIPSESMQHTLELNDRVLVNKLVYDFRSPKRGEIIVFEAPREWQRNPAGEDFIKRVIGVEGDRVRCCDQGRLVVNGHPLDEPYIFSENGVRDPAADREFEITVPPNRLWVMGDHRSASGDSLEHLRDNCPPPSGCGQNAGEDEAAKQRAVMVATVPEDAVVGRAFTIFWPFSRARWLSVPDTFKSVPEPKG